MFAQLPVDFRKFSDVDGAWRALMKRVQLQPRLNAVYSDEYKNLSGEKIIVPSSVRR